MAFVSAEARKSLLDEITKPVEELAVALAALGDAYEQLDEPTADRLEEDVFRPLQLAYGRAKKTHTDFADRYGLMRRVFRPAPSRAPSNGVKGFVEAAVDAITAADEGISELQDSMLPVEVGDAPLRAGLAEVRRMLDPLPDRARRFVSVLGR
jgi:hypothetical protein